MYLYEIKVSKLQNFENENQIILTHLKKMAKINTNTRLLSLLDYCLIYVIDY